MTATAIMVKALPVELTTMILEHLDPSILDHRRLHLETLSNVCLASKAFHGLAWPILYRDFAPQLEMPKTVEKVTSQYLRTICLEPKYGLALRKLKINEWRASEMMDGDDLWQLLYQSEATLAALLRWRARAFWLGKDEDKSSQPRETRVSNDRSDGESLAASLQHLLGMGLPEAQMALLLLLCPHITSLTISTPDLWGSSILFDVMNLLLLEDHQAKALPNPTLNPDQEESDYIVAQITGTPWPRQSLQKASILQDLTELAISGSEFPSPGLDIFKSLMSLSSLRTLMISGLSGGYQYAVADLNVDKTCPAMKKLQLRGCSLRTDEVSAIIQICPNLSEVEALWGNVGRRQTTPQAKPEWSVGYGIIGNAIATHAPNLVSLTLSTENWQYYNPRSDFPATIGHSLQQLKHLRFLRFLQLDHRAIYGFETGGAGVTCTLTEVMPKSLWSLTILSLDGARSTADELVDHWQEWQADDLNNFLRDPSFRLLCRVGFALPRSLTSQLVRKNTRTKYGWELAQDGRHGESFVAVYLVNRSRAEANGTQHVLNRHLPIVRRW